MAALARRLACGCLCLSCFAQALRHTPAADESKRRVALVLWGETFRADGALEHDSAWANYSETQLANYRSHFASVIRPFEQDGYAVDVFTATYSSPYDDLAEEAFEGRLKAYRRVNSSKVHSLSGHGITAVESLDALLAYANRTGAAYRFVVSARHDARFLEDIRQRILERSSPDDAVLLYGKRPFSKLLPRIAALNWRKGWKDAERRCSEVERFKWNVKNRSSITWWCNDMIQVFPWKFIPALQQLIKGPTLLGGKHPAPRWPSECWAELGPLVGGEEHIDFLDEDDITICKASKEHSLQKSALCELVGR